MKSITFFFRFSHSVSEILFNTKCKATFIQLPFFSRINYLTKGSKKFVTEPEIKATKISFM